MAAPTSPPPGKTPYFGPPDEVTTPYVNATVRYDPILIHSKDNTAASFKRPCPFYLLEHQWTRLQVARWSVLPGGQAKPSDACSTPANFLHGLLAAVQHWQRMNAEDVDKSRPLRVRIRSYVGGRITTEIKPTSTKPVQSLFPECFYIPPDEETSPWTLRLDKQPTEISETTMYKTSDRSWYGRARAAAGIMTLTATAEVLLYNTDGNILDGSQTTPYFFRRGRWVTPASASGGQQGTTRRWALEHGLCIEEDVSLTSIRNCECVWLSNAVQGFFWATFLTQSVDVDEEAMGQSNAIARSLR